MKKLDNIKNLTSVRTPIYSGKEKAHSRALQRLEEWNTTKSRDKELLKQFAVHLASKKDQKRRIMKLIPELMKLSEWTQVDLDKLTQEDVTLLIAEIHGNEEWEDPTKSDYIRALKTFILWREDNDRRIDSDDKEEKHQATALYKYMHKYVKSTYKRKELDPAKIIRKEDYDELVKFCITPYEEAALAILFYTGLRASEILALRWKDITLSQTMGHIRVVDGKTGSRDVPILEAIAPIMKLKQSHPDRNNPDALILISLNNRYRFKPLRYIGLLKMIQRIHERAGYLVRLEATSEQISKKIQAKITYMKKPCKLHWYRHSRATLWASVYTENVLCKLMGWISGSDEPKRYVHLCGLEVKDAFQKVNGLAEIPQKIPEIITCICGAINTGSSRYCYQCYKPLSVDIGFLDEQKKAEVINEAARKFAEVMLNPIDRDEWDSFNQTIKILPNSEAKLNSGSIKEVQQ